MTPVSHSSESWSPAVIACKEKRNNWIDDHMVAELRFTTVPDQVWNDKLPSGGLGLAPGIILYNTTAFAEKARASGISPIDRNRIRNIRLKV